MSGRQAFGWLGAAICSVALVIAGGLILSSFAVNRYLAASDSAQQNGGSATAGVTPTAGEVDGLEHTVTAITAMPGVATATTTTDPDGETPAAASTPRQQSTAHATSTNASLNYDVSVIMNPGATPTQSADVVFAMTQQLQNPRVNLELSSPAGDGHAASVVDYRSAFDTPVARTTVDSVSRAVAVAAAVPGVRSVHVMVPYTWNLAAGDLEIELASDDSQHRTALKNALSRTALAGVDWTSH